MVHLYLKKISTSKKERDFIILLHFGLLSASLFDDGLRSDPRESERRGACVCFFWRLLSCTIRLSFFSLVFAFSSRFSDGSGTSFTRFDTRSGSTLGLLLGKGLESEANGDTAPAVVRCRRFLWRRTADRPSPASSLPASAAPVLRRRRRKRDESAPHHVLRGRQAALEGGG